LVWLSFGTGKRQGSSVVEQGTHKPLVGSSTLPPGMPRHGCNRNDSVLASGVWTYLPDTGCRSTNSFAQNADGRVARTDAAVLARSSRHSLQNFNSWLALIQSQEK